MVLPVITSAVQELFTLSQCRIVLLVSLTANHSKTKPVTDWSTLALQRTSKFLSSSGLPVIWLTAGGSLEKEDDIKKKSTFVFVKFSH